MNLNRRNVLVGLGTMTIGGGAAFGSGAFSQVEAERSVTVDVAEDADALIALTAGDSAYVNEVDGQVVIDLGSEELGDADGLNLGAVTTLTEALSVTNNHEEPVELTIDGVESDDIEVRFEDGEDGGEIDGYDLGDGATLDLDIVIDTDEASADSQIDETVTVLAESTD